MTQPLIFVSYSNQDEKEKAALLTQLKGLERAGHLTVWSADSVDPGTDTGAARQAEHLFQSLLGRGFSNGEL